MDPAVLAALITTPTAVLAATAAYAAGRAQAQGSVNSIRRKDQREAYAHLRTTARAYKAQAERIVFALHGDRGVYPAPPPLTVSIADLVRQLAVTSKELDEAIDTVVLEGPPHLAELVQEIGRHAHDLLLSLDVATNSEEAAPAEPGAVRMDPVAFRRTAERKEVLVADTITEFTQVASQYLNSGKTRRWLGRWRWSRRRRL